LRIITLTRPNRIEREEAKMLPVLRVMALVVPCVVAERAVVPLWTRPPGVRDPQNCELEEDSAKK
jgi:hypothetical protein